MDSHLHDATAPMFIVILLFSFIVPFELSLADGESEQRPEIEEVVQLTNRFRIRHGLRPLRPHPLLMQAAQEHADDMADERFFAHDSRNGDTVGERLDALGYAWRTYAENIAQGQRTPEAAVQSWINSPEHRANLLSAKVTEIGVGFSVARQHRRSGREPIAEIYWVQDFGKR